MSLNAFNGLKFNRLLLPVVLGLSALNPISVAIANTNEASLFEEIDPEAENRRLSARYDDDKQRLSSAIQNTKDLIRKSQSKAYLPELYLRLAELYIEISRVSYMQIRLLQGPDASDFSALESKNYKLQAVEIYQRILNVYPKFLERDKVHFYLAHEYKELAREEDMLAQYERLIAEHPKSLLAPEALLLTGDYYFGKAETKKSQQYYEEVIEYTGNPAAVIARYKLAWVHINLKDYKTAVALLIESIEDANTQKERDVDTYDGLDIRLESLVYLAFV